MRSNLKVKSRHRGGWCPELVADDTVRVDRADGLRVTIFVAGTDIARDGHDDAGRNM